MAAARTGTIGVARGSALSVAGAAARLGVSGATVRNWLRAGLLAALDAEGPIAVAREDVDRLVRDLRAGRLGGRLRSRANKTGATGRLGRFAGDGRVEAIVKLTARARLGPAEALFLLGLNFLVGRGLVPRSGAARLAAGEPAAVSGKRLAAELADFRSGLGNRVTAAAAMPLLDSPLPDDPDVLGLLYQALSETGTRSRSGRFYTPPALAAAVAADHFRPGERVLDPCCGSGQFLLGFARLGARAEDLYGFDIDPLAARIARINLFAAFPGDDFVPNIIAGDALVRNAPGRLGEAGRFGVVAANPPWGAHYPPVEAARLREEYPDILSGESFAYFLRRSLDFLAPGGTAAFILPESILHVSRHRDIREALLAHVRIDKIGCLGRVFPDVFTPVVRIDFGAAATPGMNREGGTRRPHAAFMISTGAADARLIDKVHGAPHATLAGRADWALGIVTGDNRAHLSDRMDTGFESVIRGRDIMPFRIGPPGAFIRFEPEKMQQAAPERLYRAGDKLVYRFVSKRLVFARDTEGRLTLNSANIIIPHSRLHPPAVIAALFNSALYQFLRVKLFPGLKVLRSHLELLPLPLWEASVLGRLAEFADRAAAGEENVEGRDLFIMDSFGLTRAEKARIVASLADHGR